MTPTRIGATTAYYCEVCFLAYAKQDLATRCEEHCKTHPSCNIQIGRQAIGSVEARSKA